MNGGAQANIKVEANGSMTITSGHTLVTVLPDGTLVVSTLEPIQLTGASLEKFNGCEVNSSEFAKVLAALAKRQYKR